MKILQQKLKALRYITKILLLKIDDCNRAASLEVEIDELKQVIAEYELIIIYLVAAMVSFLLKNLDLLLRNPDFPTEK